MKKNKVIYILAYHSIEDIGYVHSVHIKQFDRQIMYLCKKYQALSYEDFCDVVEGKKKLEKDGVLVTFDDGFKDNYVNALPVLKKYNIPAVVFLTTGLVGDGVLNIRGYRFQFLNWSEVRKMMDSRLISVQNHTHTHPWLTKIDNFAAKDEIIKSSTLIESKTFRLPTAIAYPKGDYDVRIKEITKSYFKYGFLVDGGYWSEGKVDSYEIPRILISQDVSMFKFKIMLTTYFWFLREFKYMLKALFTYDSK